MGVPVKWVSVEWDSTVYYIYFILLWGGRGGKIMIKELLIKQYCSPRTAQACPPG